MKNYEVTVAFSPDRDDAFAEIGFGNKIIAEVAERSGGNVLTLFHHSGPEQYLCADFIAALQEAEAKLRGVERAHSD
ncbi:MAG: hypothetical protein EOO38_01115 [Cytophagaceae bacterium]|nr:MAG: hypothetical protein EOO38_01115 [Cytophagaceae bacterium]